MSTPLTKSYVNTMDTENPPVTDYVMSQLFDKTRAASKESLMINMDTGERITNLQSFAQGDKYAKGLLALGLKPGVDNIAILGCATFEAIALFVAAVEIGVGFTHLFLYPPRADRIASQVPMITPKVIIAGEGAGGHTFSALLTFFDEKAEKPTSEKLSSVEHLFYDNSYKDRSPTQKFVETLDKLRELGESVTDEQLMEAKKSVKPDYIAHHLFTSGGTGAPKCASRTQASIAYFLDSLPEGYPLSYLTMNMNVDSLTCYLAMMQTLTGRTKKTVVIPETYEENPFKDQGRVLVQAINNEKLNLLGVTMSTVSAIADHLRTTETELDHPMLAVAYGGQGVSKQFLIENEKLLKGIHLVGYGMTEIMVVASTAKGATPEDKESRDDCRLFPDKNLEIRIVNTENEIVDIGDVGEIQVKGFASIKEYRNDPEKTKQLFTDDGFIRTGDAGVMYPDTSIKIYGRMVDREQFNIFGKVEHPFPLEQIFCKHSDIAHAFAVIGKQNDWIGDEITICISMKKKSDRIPELELMNFCKENGMYDRQRPARIIYFEKEFPMTANQRKVSKLHLTEQVQAMVAEDDELGKCQWFIELEKSGKTY